MISKDVRDDVDSSLRKGGRENILTFICDFPLLVLCQFLDIYTEYDHSNQRVIRAFLVFHEYSVLNLDKSVS